jgi:uncharacterized membrane protein
MPLALIPTSFEELAFALGLIAVGWLLVLIGNLVLGPKKEGGKRLVLFVCGCGMSALAIFMCRHFLSAFAGQDYPAALAFYVGAVFFATGVALLWSAVFSANEKVRSWFEAVLRSI